MCIVICPLFSVVSDVSDSVCGHRCGQKYPPLHGSYEPIEEDFYVLYISLVRRGCQVIDNFILYKCIAGKVPALRWTRV